MRISAISAIKQNTKKTNSIVRIYFASFGINTEHLFYKSRLVDISTCCVTEFEIHSPLSAVFAYFCINFIFATQLQGDKTHYLCQLSCVLSKAGWSILPFSKYSGGFLFGFLKAGAFITLHLEMLQSPQVIGPLVASIFTSSASTTSASKAQRSSGCQVVPPTRFFS